MRRWLPILILLCLPATGSAHEFDETRRLVLSVEDDHLSLLVAYELRPCRLADGLRAQFDAGADGRVRTAWERMARARVVTPRLADGLSVSVDGRGVALRLEDLAFPDAPEESGRRGVAAVALFRAQLPADARSLSVRAAGGRATLEAQASAPRLLSSTDLPGRPGDPVLGPAPIRGGRALTLRLGGD